MFEYRTIAVAAALLAFAGCAADEQAAEDVEFDAPEAVEQAPATPIPPQPMPPPTAEDTLRMIEVDTAGS